MRNRIWLILVGVIIGVLTLVVLTTSVYGLIDDSFYYREKKIEKLDLYGFYNWLKRNNLYVPDYNIFKYDMRQNEKARKDIYDVLKSNSNFYGLPDSFSTFCEDLDMGLKIDDCKQGIHKTGFNWAALYELVDENEREKYTIREFVILWEHVFVFSGIFLLSLLMLYFLIKTRFGARIYSNYELKNEIKKVEHEIERVQLINENCMLTKKLDGLC